MKIDAFKYAVDAQPFRPFTIEMANGRRVAIPHPEFVWIHPADPRTVVAAEPGGGFHVIDLDLIVDLHFGGTRRRRAG